MRRTQQAQNNMKTIIILFYILTMVYCLLVTAFILIAPTRQAIKQFFTFETPSNLDWRFI
jgi:hypothetical protein